MSQLFRSRWAAVGAAVAVTLGAGGVSLTQAALSAEEKPVYVALDAPCRLVDTRPGTNIGPKNTPITAGDTGTYEFQVTGPNGNCTGGLAVPADAVAVATNVTAIAPTGAPTGRSYFTIYPGDATRPTTSNLNFSNGSPPTPNKVDVGLSTTGTIKIYNNQGTAHAAVDVFGYYIDHHHDDRYYTRTEIDTALTTKADTGDVHTRTEVDAALATKADSDDVYTKHQTDTALADKANTSDVDAALAAMFAAQYSPLVIPAAAFQPAGPADVGYFDFLSGHVIQIDGCHIAPVHLPIGATIESVTFHIADNDPDNLTVQLRRGYLSGNMQGHIMASGSSTGASSIPQNVTDSTIDGSLVGANDHYRLTFCNEASSASLGLAGVSIHLGPPG